MQSIVGGGRFAERIDLAPGERRVPEASLLEPVSVRVELTSGAAVRVGGKQHTSGARLSLPPGRHRVELVTGGAVVGRAYIQVSTTGCVLRDRPALGCY